MFANISYLINPWINYHGVGKVKLFNKFMVKGTNQFYSLDEQTKWLFYIIMIMMLTPFGGRSCISMQHMY